MQGENEGASGVTIVEPGAADDPFTQPATDQAASAQKVVDEANRAEGSVQGQPATETPTEPAKQPDPDLAALAALNDLVQGKVSQVQTGLDRKIAAMEKQATALSEQLTASERKATEAERKGKMDGMSEEDATVLQSKWDVDDAKAELDTQRKAVDDYRTAVAAYDAMTKYGHLGLTEDMFEGKSAEEIDGMMDAFEVVAKAKGEEKPGAPAGATAASDVGGKPPAAEPFKLGTEQGVGAMAANVKALFGQPGNIL